MLARRDSRQFIIICASKDESAAWQDEEVGHGRLPGHGETQVQKSGRIMPNGGSVCGRKIPNELGGSESVRDNGERGGRIPASL